MLYSSSSRSNASIEPICRFGPKYGEKMNYPRSSVYGAFPRQGCHAEENFWEQIAAGAVYVISGGQLR